MKIRLKRLVLATLLAAFSIMPANQAWAETSSNVITRGKLHEVFSADVKNAFADLGSLSPNDVRGVEPLEVMGANYFLQGKLADAERVFTKSSKLATSTGDRAQSARQKLFLGKVLSEEGRFAEAETVLNQALSINKMLRKPTEPDYIQNVEAIGMNSLRAKNFTNAIDQLQQTAQAKASNGTFSPQSVSITDYALSRAFAGVGNQEQSSSWLDKARLAFAKRTCPEFATEEPPLDLDKLRKYVVSVGNEGAMATDGMLQTDPAQIEALFQNMQQLHKQWLDSDKACQYRHVVIFLHGGLVSEKSALTTAQTHCDWFLQNHVCPIFVAWRSGFTETLGDIIDDATKLDTAQAFSLKETVASLNFNSIKQTIVNTIMSWISPPDGFCEHIIGPAFKPLWNVMKHNALQGDAPLPDTFTWPPSSDPSSTANLANCTSGSLLVDRLANYLADLKKNGHDDLKIHVIGHSAGAVYAAGILTRLAEYGVPVDSITFLAPAIRVDDFERQIVPVLQSAKVRDFTVFNMSDALELADQTALCGFGYQHSLLYYVSSALECLRPNDKDFSPLLGMQKFFDGPADVLLRQRLSGQLKSLGIQSVFSPIDVQPWTRCMAKSHGGFADEPYTMTSVMGRMLNGDGTLVPYPGDDGK